MNRTVPIMIILILSLSQNLLSQDEMITGVITKALVKDSKTSETLGETTIFGFIAIDTDTLQLGLKVNEDDLEIQKYIYISEIEDAEEIDPLTKTFKVQDVVTNKVYNVFLRLEMVGFIISFIDEKHAYVYSGTLEK